MNKSKSGCPPPIYLGDIPRIPIGPLRIYRVMGGDGIRIYLTPANELIIHPDSIEGHTLAIVARECGKHPQHLITPDHTTSRFTIHASVAPL